MVKDCMAAILKASRWLDDFDNRGQAAEVIGAEQYINAPAAEIAGRLGGVYDLGADLGEKDFKGNQMRFFRDGATNLPRKSHYIWAMAQYQRYGLLTEAPALPGAGRRAHPQRLLRGGRAAEGIDIPDDDMQPFEVVLDDVTFDPEQSRRGGRPEHDPQTRRPDARRRGRRRKTTGPGRAALRRRPSSCSASRGPDPDASDGGCPGHALHGSGSIAAGLGLVGLRRAGGGLAARIRRRSPNLPAPAETFTKLQDLLSEPFYDRGPNDKGDRPADAGLAPARVHRVRPGRGRRRARGPADRGQQAGLADVQPGDPDAATGLAAGVVPDLAHRVLRQRSGRHLGDLHHVAVADRAEHGGGGRRGAVGPAGRRPRVQVRQGRLPAPRAGPQRAARHRHRHAGVDGHRLDGDRGRRDARQRRRGRHRLLRLGAVQRPQPGGDDRGHRADRHHRLPARPRVPPPGQGRRHRGARHA